MIAMFKGKPIFGSQGPTGPDGNPIGTIISYMGRSAPRDYLICDGSVYNISDYFKLAKFFKAQFGLENYFGGDGTVTFAVPDMRNLFLRGFHGLSEEQLSGEIGKKQDATQIPYVHANTDGYVSVYVPGAGKNIIEKYDTAIMRENVTYVGGITVGSSGYRPYALTPRPVNMAVLYCIKATEAEEPKLNGTAVTLLTSGWADNMQIVNVPGVLADETAQLIQPVPALTSQSAYYAAGISCTGQAMDSLTFTANTVPVEDLVVYTVIQEVSV